MHREVVEFLGEIDYSPTLIDTYVYSKSIDDNEKDTRKRVYQNFDVKDRTTGDKITDKEIDQIESLDGVSLRRPKGKRQYWKFGTQATQCTQINWRPICV